MIPIYISVHFTAVIIFIVCIDILFHSFHFMNRLNVKCDRWRHDESKYKVLRDVPANYRRRTDKFGLCGKFSALFVTGNSWLVTVFAKKEKKLVTMLKVKLKFNRLLKIH